MASTSQPRTPARRACHTMLFRAFEDKCSPGDALTFAHSYATRLSTPSFMHSSTSREGWYSRLHDRLRHSGMLMFNNKPRLYPISSVFQSGAVVQGVALKWRWSIHERLTPSNPPHGEQGRGVGIRGEFRHILSSHPGVCCSFNLETALGPYCHGHKSVHANSL